MEKQRKTLLAWLHLPRQGWSLATHHQKKWGAYQSPFFYYLPTYKTSLLAEWVTKVKLFKKLSWGSSTTESYLAYSRWCAGGHVPLLHCTKAISPSRPWPLQMWWSLIEHPTLEWLDIHYTILEFFLKVILASKKEQTKVALSRTMNLKVILASLRFTVLESATLVPF